MLKDINFSSKDTVAIALAKNNPQDDMWIAYLLNLDDQEINTVMVSSRGYGELDGVKKETATLRWNLGEISAQSVCIIEEIPEDVLQLNNEFLISYFIENQFFNKKIILNSENVIEDFYIDLPLIHKKGILIR